MPRGRNTDTKSLLQKELLKNNKINEIKLLTFFTKESLDESTNTLAMLCINTYLQY